MNQPPPVTERPEYWLWTSLEPEACRQRISEGLSPAWMAELGPSVYDTGRPKIEGQALSRGFSIRVGRAWDLTVPMRAAGRFLPAEEGTQLRVRFVRSYLPFAAAVFGPLLGLGLWSLGATETPWPLLALALIWSIVGLARQILFPHNDRAVLLQFLCETLEAREELGPRATALTESSFGSRLRARLDALLYGF